jgi:protein arginine kinase activator
MATIHITENTDGVKNISLCEDCAADEGLTPKKHMAPGELLNALVLTQQSAAAETSVGSVCPECKTTYAEFRQTGLLGCPNCYAAFDAQLTPLLERAHDGLVEHFGKVPRKAGGSRTPQTDIVRLRRELKAALEHEDYETAARLRDSIRELERS